MANPSVQQNFKIQMFLIDYSQDKSSLESMQRETQQILLKERSKQEANF